VPDSNLLGLGVLISGGGSTLENLIRRIRDGRLRAVDIRLVISTRSTVRGVDVARNAGLPVQVVRPKEFGDASAFSAAISGALRQAKVDLAVMGGFLSLWELPQDFRGRVLNIHPALLPRFGGKGYYGRNVHEAVLAAGDRESGCSVHIVDEEYDHGPIIAQAKVPVLPNDTAESLAERVGCAERELYPQIIQQIATHGLTWLDQYR